MLLKSHTDKPGMFLMEENLTELWKKYNFYTLKITEVLGRTSNIVGEYAEHLVNNHLKGRLLEASTASADIETSDKKLYQVKARKITQSSTTQLSIIRSWNFDFLAVILFNKDGSIFKSIICPKDIAKDFSTYNKHQNGWVITTTYEFLNNSNNLDITNKLKKYNGEEQVSQAPKTLDLSSVNTEDTKEAVSKKSTISRSKAFEIISGQLYKKYNISINKKQFVFSNQNKANDRWWLEPRKETFENDLFIALNNQKHKKLYLFKIPSKALFPPKNYFKIRDDTDKPSIAIEGHDTMNFQDCSKGSKKIYFKKFLLEIISYK